MAETHPLRVRHVQTIKQIETMKTKTIVRIEPDYMSGTGYDEWSEDVNQLASGLDVSCTISNKEYMLPFDSGQDVESYAHTLRVSARGYVQSEWQEYKLHYNSQSDELNALVSQLGKTFTHKHDYLASKHKAVTISGKEYTREAHDLTWFSISAVEFPEKKDVFREYVEIYGTEHDRIEYLES